MYSEQRVFLSKSGVFEDITYEVSEFLELSETLELQANDYIYLATEAPFNSRYFHFLTPNDVAVGFDVQIYDGNQWFDAVDLIDETKGLTQSGQIRFAIDLYGERNAWGLSDSKDVTDVPADVNVFQKYWMRVKVLSTLHLSTSLSFLGLKFSTDADLFSIYPELRNTSLMNAWKTGKANWNEEHFSAADHIIMKLRDMGVIGTRSGFKIMDTQYIKLPSIHKCAEIVFTGLGPAYKDRAELAHGKFLDAMNMKYFNVDINGDGQLSKYERRAKTGFFSR
jgi:hypothetical protein